MVMKREKLTVKASDVRSIKMSVNPPKVVVDAGYRVIHDGKIKCWVGIGWLTEGRASKSDYYKIPEVVNG
jgi:hypothetical protein